MTHETISKILHEIHVKTGDLYYSTETVIEAMKEAVSQVLDEAKNEYRQCVKNGIGISGTSRKILNLKLK